MVIMKEKLFFFSLLAMISQAKIQDDKCRSLLDLVCVVDGSDSITDIDFTTLRETVAHLVDLFTIGKGEGRMGIVVYSSEIAFKVPLTDNPKVLIDNALRLPHPMEGTRTDLGLKEMRDIFINDKERKMNKGVPAVGLVLTDGRSKKADFTLAEARALKKEGVEMYAVGIGSLIKMDELKSIASADDHVFMVDTFDQLADDLESLVKLVCPKVKYGLPCKPEREKVCLHDPQVQCIDNGDGFKCQCLHEDIDFFDGIDKCRLRGDCNDPCVPGIARSCLYEDHLICVDQGDGTGVCQCSDLSKYYWDPVNKVCRVRQDVNKICQQGIPESCLYETELACMLQDDNSYMCQCPHPSTQYWDPISNTCKQRGDNNFPCQPGIVESCLYSQFLTCKTLVDGSYACQCSNTDLDYWDSVSKICRTRSDCFQTCQAGVPESCLYSNQLVCAPQMDGSYACQCPNPEMHYWDKINKICKLRSDYGGYCQEMHVKSCLYDDQLICKVSRITPDSLTCQCPDEDTHYWNRVNKLCTPRSDFMEKCYLADSRSCLYSDQLVCREDVNGGAVCVCSDADNMYFDTVTHMCRSRGHHLDPCQEGLVDSCFHVNQLYCKPDDSGAFTCQCFDESFLYWDKDHQVCKSRSDYMGFCRENEPNSCLYTDQLVCLPDEFSFACQCVDESKQYFDTVNKKCTPRVNYDQVCQLDHPRSCLLEDQLKCKHDGSGIGLCQCDDMVNFYWDTLSHDCKPRSDYGGSCQSGHPLSCMFHQDLGCYSSSLGFQCLCHDETNKYYDQVDHTCKKRSIYGERCDALSLRSCLFESQLQCTDAGSDGYKCLCKDHMNMYWDNVNNVCKQRSGYNDTCSVDHPRSCQPEGDLVCVKTAYTNFLTGTQYYEYICQCPNEQTHYWDFLNKKCQIRGGFHQTCQKDHPRSCLYHHHLQCKQNTDSGYWCQCENPDTHFWDSASSAFSCRERVDYREPCQAGHLRSCLYDNFLQCVTIDVDHSLCLCTDEVNNFWNSYSNACEPRSHYGGPCTSEFPKSCMYESDLKCFIDGFGQGICRCENEESMYWDPDMHICRPRNDFQQVCQEGQIRSCLYEDQLVCKSVGDWSACVCPDHDKMYWDPTSKTCMKRCDYGEACAPGVYDSCLFNNQLQCVTGSDGLSTCRCENEDTHFWFPGENICKPRSSYGGICYEGFKGSCLYSKQLTCQSTDDGPGTECRCADEISYYWNENLHQCMPRSGFHELCYPVNRKSCLFEHHLKCLDIGDGLFTCQCENEMTQYWNQLTKSCEKRSDYRQVCQSSRENSCLYPYQLVCLASDEMDMNVCECSDPTHQYWDPIAKVCRDSALYGSKCQPGLHRACLHSEYLTCNPEVSSCICINEQEQYWNEDSLSCLPRATYKGQCNPKYSRSCMFSTDLLCLSSQSDPSQYLCRCENEETHYFDPLIGVCKTRSDHNEICDGNPGSCLYGDFLSCRPNMGGLSMCQCDDETLTYYDRISHVCRMRADYDNVCQEDHPRSCLHDDYLRCRMASDGKMRCLCENESVHFWDTALRKCDSRDEYGNECVLGNRRSCFHDAHLACKATSDGRHTCQCRDEDNYYWDDVSSSCRLRNDYNQECQQGKVRSCRYDMALQCVDVGNNVFRCLCGDEAKFYFDTVQSRCLPRSTYGQQCQEDHVQSCLFNKMLRCQQVQDSKTFVCLCDNENDFYWDALTNTCQKRNSYGGPCVLDNQRSCLYNSYLQCVPSQTTQPVCLCADEVNYYWNSESLTCELRNNYGDPCDVTVQKSCRYDDQLKCVPIGDDNVLGICQCLNEEQYYWDSYSHACLLKSTYNQSCTLENPDSCYTEWNLKCTETSLGTPICLCKDHKLMFWDDVDKDCKKRCGYGEECSLSSSRSCLYNSQLLCVPNGQLPPICQCAQPESTYWDPEALLCKKRSTHGGQCDQTKADSCLFSDMLACKPSEDLSTTCQCKDGSLFWNVATNTCENRGEYHGSCSPSQRSSCMYNSLRCVYNRCVCPDESTQFWNPQTFTCDQRSCFGNKCIPGVERSCLEEDQLVCVQAGYDHICQCKDMMNTYWDSVNRKCRPRVNYGEVCQAGHLRSCIHDDKLKCKPTSSLEVFKCQCENENTHYWNHFNKTCMRRADYYQACEVDNPRSCLYESYLKCKSSFQSHANMVCQCEDEKKYFWDEETLTCQETALYGQACKSSVVGSCEKGSQMICTDQGLGITTCGCDENTPVWDDIAHICKGAPTTHKPKLEFADAGPCTDCVMDNGIGYNPHPDDCTKFTQCYFGEDDQVRAIYRECPFAFFYDEDKMSCVPADQTVCPQDKCASGKLYAYPNNFKNCRAFWQCVNGRSVAKCCPMGYRFDFYFATCIRDARCTEPCPPPPPPVRTYQCRTRPCPERSDEYEIFLLGLNRWIDMPCPPGTLYDVSDCACTKIKLPESHHGKCKPEVLIKFDDDTKDCSGKNNYIQNHGVKLVGDGTGYFNGNAYIDIPRFANMDFDTIVIRAKYKADMDIKPMAAIVSNSDCCHYSPTLLMAAGSGSVHFAALTQSPKTNTSSLTTFYMPMDNFAWNKVTFAHDTHDLKGCTNIAQQKVQSEGHIIRSHGGIQIGVAKGYPKFKGYMDELAVYTCKPDDIL